MPLSVQLTGGNDSKDTIRIDDLSISFYRTIRVRNSDCGEFLPPNISEFSLYSVAGHRKLPRSIKNTGGFFFFMNNEEAVSIGVGSTYAYAMRIYAGSINVISGRDIQDGQTGAQDYIILPEQSSLDGIVVSPELVRQFVAVPPSSSFSIESQTARSGSVDTFLFEITPAIQGWRSATPGIRFFIKTLTGKELTVESVDDQMTILELHNYVAYKEGIPVGQQRLCLNGRQLSTHSTLAESEIFNGSTLHLYLKLSGGGGRTVSLAPGGLIHQKVIKDGYPSFIWQKEKMIALNVHILNVDSQRHIAGTKPEPRPMDSLQYARLNLPYYQDHRTTAGADIDHFGVNPTLLPFSPSRGSSEPHHDNRVVELDDAQSARELCTFDLLLASAEARTRTEATMDIAGNDITDSNRTSNDERNRNRKLKLADVDQICLVM